MRIMKIPELINENKLISSMSSFSSSLFSVLLPVALLVERDRPDGIVKIFVCAGLRPERFEMCLRVTTRAVIYRLYVETIPVYLGFVIFHSSLLFFFITPSVVLNRG